MINNNNNNTRESLRASVTAINKLKTEIAEIETLLCEKELSISNHTNDLIQLGVYDNCANVTIIDRAKEIKRLMWKLRHELDAYEEDLDELRRRI